MPFLMVCLVGLLVSVDASPVSPPVISGQVRLSDGSPVAGAQVVLFDVADLRRGRGGASHHGRGGNSLRCRWRRVGLSVLPSEVALGQNYPNPFNPSTLIPYQLATPSPVRLEVFNMLGSAGGDAGGWPARGRVVCGAVGWHGCGGSCGAASGVYFYRLTVAGAHQTGKMVLVDGQAGVPLGGARVRRCRWRRDRRRRMGW